MYKIDRELLVKVQTKDKATLARLSREDPVLRALFGTRRDSRQFRCGVLRRDGDGQSEKVPHVLNLYNLFRPDRSVWTATTTPPTRTTPLH